MGLESAENEDPSFPPLEQERGSPQNSSRETLKGERMDT